MPNQNECDHEIGVSGANNCVEDEREYRQSREFTASMAIPLKMMLHEWQLTYTASGAHIKTFQNLQVTIWLAGAKRMSRATRMLF